MKNISNTNYLVDSTNNIVQVLGILGGGQLAKMLALEAYRLGLNVAIIDKEANTPAGDMTKMDFNKGWNDKEELNRFINACDIVTLENEFISPDILEYIEKYREVYPTSSTMKLIQDKYIQKKTLDAAGIATPEFDKVETLDDLHKLEQRFGYPFIIKTRTMGYDGYGNMTINSREDMHQASKHFANSLDTKSSSSAESSTKSDCQLVNSLASAGHSLLAEKFIDFEMELAVMVVRSKTGKLKTYPCVQTIQKNHICHEVIAPCDIDIDLAEKARELAEKTVLAVDGVGVFGVEMFLTKDNKILVNEIAPRPHNSGHYTIEACQTSQYENAIRAILGAPLGSCEMLCEKAIMTNILGQANTETGINVFNMYDIFAKPNTKIHIYNKKLTRIGRKMGHLTTVFR